MTPNVYVNNFTANVNVTATPLDEQQPSNVAGTPPLASLPQAQPPQQAAALQAQQVSMQSAASNYIPPFPPAASAPPICFPPVPQVVTYHYIPPGHHYYPNTVAANTPPPNQRMPVIRAPMANNMQFPMAFPQPHLMQQHQVNHIQTPVQLQSQVLIPQQPAAPMAVIPQQQQHMQHVQQQQQPVIIPVSTQPAPVPAPAPAPIPVEQPPKVAEEEKFIEIPPTSSASSVTPEPVKNETAENTEEDEVPEEEKETIVEEPKNGGAKSWASLFHHQSSSSSAHPGPAVEKTISNVKPTARIIPFNNGTSSEKKKEAGSELAEFLKNYNLNHKSPSIKPRGLSNQSNWCFVNAILQALVACPPFFNLIKALPAEVLNEDKSILKSLYEFFQEFQPMEKFPKQHRRGKKNEDLLMVKTFEATSVYKTLLDLNSDNFKVVEGRQEDAEEFLTFLLNGVNDEMLALLKTCENENNNEENEEENNNEREEDEEEDDWKEVGPNNKGCVTRRTTAGSSPLASMVQGQIRSCVQPQNGEPTATLQPFFTLQLDITDNNVKTVNDTIAINFSTESIEGYVCQKTKEAIAISRSLYIEELPPILILHLKRFVYDSSGGVQKLMKNVDFPVDLEINRDILSPSSKSKYQAKQRQYKLFAVVYHNGSEASKGHYVTDIYHTGLSTWLRCDDSIVKSVSEANVLTHSHNSCPYILFYRNI